MKTISTALFLASMALAACGAPMNNPDASDASDAGTQDSGGNPDTGVACTVSTADFGDKGALQGEAVFFAGETSPAENSVAFIARLEPAGTTPDGIRIELYKGLGVFKMSASNPDGSIKPGTYQLTGEELAYETCGACVLINTNTTQTGYQDDYLATGGTLTVTAAADAVGGTLTGTLTNVTFRHVTINENTNVSTPVNDGCTTKMMNATFTGTLLDGDM